MLLNPCWYYDTQSHEYSQYSLILLQEWFKYKLVAVFTCANLHNLDITFLQLSILSAFISMSVYLQCKIFTKWGSFRICYFTFTLSRVFQLTNFRSSHRRCSVWKGLLINFAIFTGKHLSQSNVQWLYQNTNSTVYIQKKYVI